MDWVRYQDECGIFGQQRDDIHHGILCKVLVDLWSKGSNADPVAFMPWYRKPVKTKEQLIAQVHQVASRISAITKGRRRGKDSQPGNITIGNNQTPN